MASNTREKLVSAAGDRFRALGFSACGVQEIVDKAGVPKGSFYNHFKAKELLAVAVVEAYSESTGNELLADRSVAAIVRLRDHFECMAARYAQCGYDKGCLIATLAAEMTCETPLVRDAVVRSLAGWTDSVEQAIRDGQSDGSIAAALEAASTARFLVDSWIGAVTRTKLLNDAAPLDDFFALAFLLLQAPDARQRPEVRPAGPSP